MQKSKETARRSGKVVLFGNVRVLSVAALLAAMSIVCGKYLAIRGGDILRFSFENLPLILSGIWFGPLVGMVTAIVADLLGCVLVGYAINPIVTLGAALIGASAGIASYAGRECRPFFRLALTVSTSHLLGSVLVKTLGLAAFYDMPIGVLFLWRLLNYAIVGGIEYFLLWALLRNRGVQSLVDKLKS